MSCARCAVFFFFFFNDTATPEIYPLPLHAALPIPQPPMLLTSRAPRRITPPCSISFWVFVRIALSCMSVRPNTDRSEEHTSELQSLAYLVCRLLLEKKKHQERASPDQPSHAPACST